jgi:hypothetical protein
MKKEYFKRKPSKKPSHFIVYLFCNRTRHIREIYQQKDTRNTYIKNKRGRGILPWRTPNYKFVSDSYHVTILLNFQCYSFVASTTCTQNWKCFQSYMTVSLTYVTAQLQYTTNLTKQSVTYHVANKTPKTGSGSDTKKWTLYADLWPPSDS